MTKTQVLHKWLHVFMIGKGSEIWPHKKDLSKKKSKLESVTHFVASGYLRVVFCHTYFSMGELGMQVSVRPFVHPSTFILGVLWAQPLLQFCTHLFETLHVFSSWYRDVHVVWIYRRLLLCRLRVSRYYHLCRSDFSFPTFFLYVSLHFNSVYVENG